MRPRGLRFPRPLTSGTAAAHTSIISVSVPPGARQFTRTPSRPWSAAAWTVRPMTPCLLAGYGPSFGPDRKPPTLLVLTTEPPPVRRIALISADRHRQTPTRLTSINRTTTSSVLSAIPQFPRYVIPELLNAQSSRP